MSVRKGWAVAWLAWLAAFATLETRAVLDKRRGDTLSEHFWLWSSMFHKGRFWRTRRVIFSGALFGGAAWLCVHLVTGVSDPREVLTMPAFLLPLIPLLAKFAMLSGPLMVFVLRYIVPRFFKGLPSYWQPVAAAVVSFIVAILTGADPMASLDGFLAALKVALESGGVIKGIDLLKNKADTVTPEGKAIVEAVHRDSIRGAELRKTLGMD